MRLVFDNKRSEREIIRNTPPAKLAIPKGTRPSLLIRGENMSVMKTLLADFRTKIGLVYIDPPFATNGSFTIGADRANTVSRSNRDAVAYSDTLVGAEFLEFLRERLFFIRELMSEQASIYLHIDYKIGHYVKLVMDEVFGCENFRNDITRIKCNPNNFHRRAYGNIKDLILFYSKSDKLVWNDVKNPFTEEEIARLFGKRDKSGRAYTTIPLHAPGETNNGITGKEWRGMRPPKGRHWRTDPKILEEWDREGLIEWSLNGVPRKKIFADEKSGKRIQDIWEFKDPQYPSYPTQKNLELLKLIVRTSSNEDDFVLDCFCGSGTTLVAAQELGRRWIGIDQSPLAISACKERLSQCSTNLFTRVDYEFLVQSGNKQQEGRGIRKIV
jgi:adenine-specific DNA-methyltransferase